MYKFQNIHLKLHILEYKDNKYAEARPRDNFQRRMAYKFFEIFVQSHFVHIGDVLNQQIQDPRVFTRSTSYTGSVVHDYEGKHRRHRKQRRRYTLTFCYSCRQCANGSRMRTRHSAGSKKQRKIDFFVGKHGNKKLQCLCAKPAEYCTL